MLTKLWHSLIPRKKLPHRLPFDLMVDDRTLFTKTGGMMWTANCVGLDPDSVDPATIDAYFDQLAALQGRQGDGCTIFYDQWRWRCDANLRKCDSGVYAAHLIDEAERAQFTSAFAFENTLYTTFHYEPDRGRSGLMEWLSSDDQAFSRSAMVRRFREDAEKFFGGLQLIMPKVTLLENDALYTYLAHCVSYEPYGRRMPDLAVGLNWALGSAKWRAGIHPMIGRNHIRTVEMFSMGALTAETLRFLDQLNFPRRWVVRVDTTARHQQAKWLSRMRAEYDQRRQSAWRRILQHLTRRDEGDTDPAAAYQMAEADQLRVDVHLGDTGFAPCTVTVHVFDQNREVAEERALEVELGLKDRDFSCEKASISAITALLADIPGNDPQPREIPAFHPQIVRIAPLVSVSKGNANDAKWNGPALMLGHSDAGEAVRVAWHAPGQINGSTGIIGNSGNGKSALAAKMMAATIQKYRDSRVIVFDIGRSFMPTCLCLGGDWIDLADGKPVVQLFRHVDDPGQALLIYDWLLRALAHQGVPLTHENKHAVNAAMDLMVDLPIDQRTMTAYVQRVGESIDVREALRIFTRAGGRYGETFDGIVDSYGEARVVGIECGAIRKSEILPLLVSAIFDALYYERLRPGYPSVIMFDEFHEFLKMPAFADEADRISRQIRKHFGVLVIATQSPADMTTELAAVIDAQCPNRIVTQNPNALEPNQARFYRSLGYSDAMLREIATGIPRCDYFTKERKFRHRMHGDDLLICGRTDPVYIEHCCRLRDEGVPAGEQFTQRWLQYDGKPIEQELAA